MPKQAEPALTMEQDSTCKKCGKQKFGPYATMCTAMALDQRYMEMYCHCATVFSSETQPVTEQLIRQQIGFIRNEMQNACPSVRPGDREWILAVIITEVEKAWQASRRQTLEEVIGRLREMRRMGEQKDDSAMVNKAQALIDVLEELWPMKQ